MLILAQISISWPLNQLIAHFPTELKQCRKFHQRRDICFLKAKRVYKKTLLTVKSNNLGFWSNFMSKLETLRHVFRHMTCGHV